MCNCEDVSKKVKRSWRSCDSEHGWRLLLIVYFYVHVLVKLGVRCGSRCRLQLYSEKTVDVLVDCMIYGDEGRRSTN